MLWKISIRNLKLAKARSRGNFNFVKSYDAVDINYEKHGFRKIGRYESTLSWRYEHLFIVFTSSHTEK